MNIKKCSNCGKDHKNVEVVNFPKPFGSGDMTLIGYFYCPKDGRAVFVTGNE